MEKLILPKVEKHSPKIDIVLPNAALEQQVLHSKLNNPNIAVEDVNNLKIQAFLLTKVNDEGKNVLHIACAKGNYELCKFIIEKAGPKYLNILSFIVRKVDDMGRTPLYMLCVLGFEGEFDLQKQRKEGYRKKIIELLIPPLE